MKSNLLHLTKLLKRVSTLLLRICYFHSAQKILIYLKQLFSIFVSICNLQLIILLLLRILDILLSHLQSSSYASISYHPTTTLHLLPSISTLLSLLSPSPYSLFPAAFLSLPPPYLNTPCIP